MCMKCMHSGNLAVAKMAAEVLIVSHVIFFVLSLVTLFVFFCHFVSCFLLFIVLLIFFTNFAMSDVCFQCSVRLMV